MAQILSENLIIQRSNNKILWAIVLRNMYSEVEIHDLCLRKWKKDLFLLGFSIPGLRKFKQK